MPLQKILLLKQDEWCFTCHTVTRRSPPRSSAESAAVADCISSDPWTAWEFAGMCRLAKWWPKSLGCRTFAWASARRLCIRQRWLRNPKRCPLNPNVCTWWSAERENTISPSFQICLNLQNQNFVYALFRFSGDNACLYESRKFLCAGYSIFNPRALFPTKRFASHASWSLAPKFWSPRQILQPDIEDMSRICGHRWVLQKIT